MEPLGRYENQLILKRFGPKSNLDEHYCGGPPLGPNTAAKEQKGDVDISLFWHIALIGISLFIQWPVMTAQKAAQTRT